MKISVSISDPAHISLTAMANTHDTNLSTMVESAVRYFATLPDQTRAKVVRETHAGKRALTRTGWMSVFLDVLAEEFGVTDPYTGTSDHVYAPRTYDGFSVVFLMNYANKPDSDTDPLIVHVWKVEVTDVMRTIDMYFNQEESVYDAARKVASWIRDQKFASATRGH